MPDTAPGPREELLGRAVAWFAEHGVGDTSLRTLAAGIGTSHRMLNYHFGSREGLLGAVVEAVEQAEHAALLELAATHDDPFEAGRRVLDPGGRPRRGLRTAVLRAVHPRDARPAARGGAAQPGCAPAGPRPSAGPTSTSGVPPERAGTLALQSLAMARGPALRGGRDRRPGGGRRRRWRAGPAPCGPRSRLRRSRRSAVRRPRRTSPGSARRRPRAAAAAPPPTTSTSPRSVTVSQSRTYCLSKLGCGWPGSHWSAGQNRDESGVSTSSASTTSSPRRPNSTLVSASRMPRAGGDLVAALRGSRRSGRAPATPALAPSCGLDDGVGDRLVVLAHRRLGRRA